MSRHHARAACMYLRAGLHRPATHTCGRLPLRAACRSGHWGQSRLSVGLAVLAHRQFATKPVPSISNNGKTPMDANGTVSDSDSEVPSDAWTKKVASLTEDENITLFHRASKQIINMNLDPKDLQLSLFFPKNREIVNLSFKETFKADVAKAIEAQKETSDSTPRVTSVQDMMWMDIKLDYSRLPEVYMKLAKIRLTGLVVITQMAGYAMAPGVFDPVTFLVVSLGTALTSASANSINQFLEIPFDSQMNRTKNRPLVLGSLTPLHAMGFALASGTAGVTMLYLGVNSLTAGLGLFNLCLYTMCYTPMKRMSIANTWLGSVVGSIPPMMGWAACSGGLEPGAWLLAAIMYAWQFPHFNALSWNLRGDYSRAGYRMMSVINPALCKRVALRYSVGMIGLCTLAPILDVTTWTFAVDSLPANVYLSYLAWRFYQDGNSNSSRKLFRFTLVHIPLVLALMLISKKHYGKKKEVEVVESPLLKAQSVVAVR